MVLLVTLAVAIPVVLVVLVLLKDRYLPWMKRHERAISIAGGVGEVAGAVAYLPTRACSHGKSGTGGTRGNPSARRRG